jgi:Probable cobalt transporter subunit (CbtB)
MSSISMPTTSSLPRGKVSTEALPETRLVVLISLTMLVALAIYYLVGVDEGMTSVFGKTMMIHEWVHDARHFLGFPCH